MHTTSECGYIISECHLPLGGDWPSAGKYGGCASQICSECLHYLLHPPSSDKIKLNKN